MAAEQFISRLEQLGLIDESLIRRLRKQVAEAKSPVSAKAIAKLLIEKGQLTPPQAKKLLAELEPGSGATAKQTPAAPTPAAKPKPAPSNASDELVPLDDMGLTPIEETAGLVPLDETAGLVPLDEPAGLTPIESNAELTPLETLEELTPLNDSAGISPMEELMPLDAGGAVGGDAFGYGGAASAPTPTAPQIKKLKQKGWDSPLILLGGGALLLILLAGGVLLYSLTRTPAAAMLEEAEKLYREEAYDQAIVTFEKYLKQYPSDPRVSEARVRKGTAKLRIAVDVGKDMKYSLETAKQVIAETEKEPAFDKARDELAAMLPKIAEAFANAAKVARTGAQAEGWLKLADEAMELVNNPSYVSSNQREAQQQRFDGIKRTIALAKRTIAQDKSLQSVVDQMKTLLGEGKTSEAFELRKNLLRDYPGVESEESLVSVVRAVAAKERDLVKVVDAAIASDSNEPERAIQMAKLTPSHRKGGEEPELSGQVVFVLARGSVFGLDASSGKVLWRRAVGAETLHYPVALAKENGGDALFADGRRNELVRLDAKTGALKWRLPIGEEFNSPVPQHGKVFVTTVSGRVLEVDPETGRSDRHVQLPQPTSVATGGDGRTPMLYQVGGHSNLYAISTESFTCPEVHYLGHRAGAMAVPPVLVLKHLIIAENAGPDHSVLHVLAVDDSGLGLRVAQEKPIRVSGNITTPLLPYRNRVIVVSDLGEVKVLEIDPEQKSSPAKVVAEQVRTVDTPQPGFAVGDSNTLWIANNRLASFDIQTSRGQLNSRWSMHEDETFVGPLHRFGSVLIHTRRRRGSSGLTVTAVKSDKGTLIWRSDLAVPMAAIVSDVAVGTAAINAHGDIFEVTGVELKKGIVDKPKFSVEPDGSEVAFEFGDPAFFGPSRVALSNRSDRTQVMIYDPSQPTAARLTRLDFSGHVPVQSGVAYANSLLIPFDVGYAGLLQPDTGKPTMLPFQPRLEPGKKVEWTAPLVIGADRREFVIADDARRLFRVGVKKEPEMHLAAAAQVELPARPSAPLAVADTTCYCPTRGPSGNDLLVPVALPALTIESEITLAGRLIAGPWTIGNTAVLVTDQEGVVAFGAASKKLWSQPLEQGPLAGPPLVTEGTWVFASRSGFLWQVDPATGNRGPSVDLGESLRGAPARLGTNLLFTASDGTLLVVRPTLPPPQ